jgi:hypothetical protein
MGGVGENVLYTFLLNFLGIFSLSNFLIEKKIHQSHLGGSKVDGAAVLVAL